MKLIDKDALVAEIEKIRKTLNMNLRHDQGVCDGLYAIQKAINSLEVREVNEEPVSEPNKELAETYLAVFNKKFPILPSLSGKQLADYKNFLNECQQIFGLKEWGIRPIQSKLFEKLTLLWAAWGAEHLQGVGRQDEKEQDIPVSEDLGEYVNELSKQFPEVSFAKLSRIAVRVAKWQNQQDQSTIELAEDHAMFAGMEKMKEKMMAKAIDGKIYETQVRSELKAVTTGNLSRLDYKVGDKVKVIVIKEG